MITIKPTTARSLIMELPHCSGGEATGAGFAEDKRAGHTRAIIHEDQFDEFLIALLEARRLTKDEKYNLNNGG